MCTRLCYNKIYISLSINNETSKLLINEIMTDTTSENLDRPAEAVPTPSPTPVAPGSLVMTKLFMPNLSDRLLPRPRLADRLQLGYSQSKLVLVTAPAGFGKTTAVIEWLHQHQLPNGQKIGWLSLDSDDNEPVRFWEYFVEALESLLPGLKAKILGLLHAQPSTPSEQLVVIMINHLVGLTGPAHLVLDDYHLITDPSIQRGLAYLLDHQPTYLHLIITSRTEPAAPMPLARLRVRGQLTELRATDLRFTTTETEEFLSSIMHLPIVSSSFSAVETRTEGWIAAIQLAALLMQSYKDARTFIKAFNADQRFLLDYLAEEVLERQPEAIQTFLLQTSIVEHFNASLVEELTGCEDGYAMLRQVEQANLFLISLDDEHGWYRYHHLFRQYLRNRLERTQADHIPLLHRWAAQWYDNHGMTNLGVEHALAAKAWPYAAELLDKATQPMYERGELRTLLRWLQTLPDEFIYQRPHMSCNYSWVLILLGRAESAVPYAEAEARGLDLIEQASAPILPPEIIRAIRGEIAAIWAAIYRSRGEFARSIELGDAALAQIFPSQLFLRCAIVVNQAHCYKALENWSVAQQKYGEAERLGRECGSGYFMLVGLVAQGQLLQQQGRLREATAIYRRALSHQELNLLPVMSHAWVGLGEVQRETNDLEEAAASLSRALEKLELGDADPLSLPVAYAELARVRVAQNQLEEAVKLLEKADTAMEQEAPSLPIPLELAQARLWLEVARGDRPTPGEPGAALANLSRPAQEGWQLLRMQWQLAQRQFQAALPQAKEVLKTAKSGERLRHAIESQLVQASVFVQSNEPQAAYQVVLEALQQAEPEGFVRVFVDEGRLVLDLLSDSRANLVTAGVSTHYLTKLLAASNKPTTVVPALTDLPKAAIESARPTLFKLIEPLTEREQAVLRLIVNTTLNTTEIANEMSVAVSTVRTHIKNIYSKLEVQSRLEAIQRSHELDLL